MFRLAGGGRKLMSEELEEMLISRIEEERLEKRRVSRTMVVKWAKRYSEFFDVDNFSGSNGWLEGFLERNQFSLRKTSNMSNLSEIVKRGVSFVRHTHSLIQDYNVEKANVFNFDETSIFVEDDRHVTIERIGQKRVAMSTAGFSKVRLTGICCASAEGRKLQPVLITKGATEGITNSGGAVSSPG